MPSKWIEHIRDFAKRNNLTYGCALSDPKCSEEYRNKYPKPVKAVKGKQEEETFEITPVKRKKIKKKLDLSKTEFVPLEEAIPDTEPKTKMVVAKKPPVKKIPALTETAEKKEERKEKERKRIAEALYRSIDDLTFYHNSFDSRNKKYDTYYDDMSLSDALLTMFPDIQLTTEKLHSLPQILKDGKHTGQLLLFSYSGIKKVAWFMEYVNNILRGNFTGINKKKYEATYNRIHAVRAGQEDKMFEMGEEDTRSRSKREYLKSPFNKFYIGEEVKTPLLKQKRAIIVRQTKAGVTLKPKEGGKTFNIRDKQMEGSFPSIEKIIEGTGVEGESKGKGFLSLLTGKPHSVADFKKLFERAYIILSDLSENGSISSNADNLLSVINDERLGGVVESMKKKEGKIAWYEKKIEDIRQVLTPQVFDRLFEPNPSKKDPTEVLGRELPTVDRQSEFINPVKKMGRGIKLTRDMVMEMVGKGMKC